jgi:uncharacterized GH25 family protein
MHWLSLEMLPMKMQTYKVSCWFLAFVLGILLPASSAFGHDYWLVPEKFSLAPEESVKIHLYYGDELKIEDERPLQKERTPRFEQVSTEGTVDLLPTNIDGQKPFATLSFPKPGSYVLTMDRNAQNIVLKGPEFTKYLKEEGLTDILARRNPKAPGRERYVRSVKTLIQVGERITDIPLKPNSQRLEILPLQNPLRLKPGYVLVVQLLFDGFPLMSRQIQAYHLENGKLITQTKRTDGQGKAFFRLDQAGSWLIRTVHMRPCKQNCRDTDWESFWSSLSFEIAAP